MPHLYTWILLYSTDLQYAKIHRMNLSLGYILNIKYSQIFWIEFQPQFSYERLKEGIRYAL